MADWQPVTNAAGGVLGWVAAPDPDEPDVDWWEADRVAKVGRRAAVLDQAAALFVMDGVDPEQTWDGALAHGLTDADLDAAAHVAVTLRKLELDLE
jgi:hypothetical protein